ncbi:hypothetical protein HZQ56_14345 [Elizabethkingia anophelis]|nr:hypothetical protein [Elizabethkingia anophelis]MCT3874347.1 hypothetical protein [Elizabethkingia anophelis]
MNKQELRIGNYIEYNGKVITVSDIYLSTGIIAKKEYTVNGRLISDVNPLLLSDEYLSKLGFSKNKIGYTKTTSLDRLIAIGFGSDSITINNVRFQNQIKYVHQLQNLYFALTGEELTIKS